MTTEEFIKKAREIHGDKYDYHKVIYTKTHGKVCIICPEHGEFLQEARYHLQGKGCFKCAAIEKGKKRALTKEDFILRSRKTHGDKYDYTKVEYKNNSAKVCIICPEHGEFWQIPYHHLIGCGCPKCAGNAPKNTIDFINQSNEIHNGKYDYSLTHYTNAQDKVTIICPIHGKFNEIAGEHMYGHGCPKCASNAKLTLKDFIEKSKKVHKDKYDYTNSIYVNTKTIISIVCPEHGEFLQSPDNHMQGAGCPSCAHKISKAENNIFEYVESLIGSENTLKRDRIILRGKELDIYIPSKKIAIEYNGLIWHSERFKEDAKYTHLNKAKECQKQGIKLIHIFEDEWLEHPEIVKDKLRSYLGCNNAPVVGARKCAIKEIGKAEAEQFLDANHIQGFVSSTIYLGAFHQDKLVGVMSFKKENNKSLKWDLNRFATDMSMRFPGLASKLFEYFKKHYEYQEVKSFLDLRWNQVGNTVYEKIGFKLEKIEKPDYYYIVDKKRVHKFNCRKQKLHKKYGLPLSMTEKEMCDQLGFYRIWNCGLAKYVYKHDK